MGKKSNLDIVYRFGFRNGRKNDYHLMYFEILLRNIYILYLFFQDLFKGWTIRNLRP